MIIPRSRVATVSAVTAGTGETFIRLQSRYLNSCLSFFEKLPPLI